MKILHAIMNTRKALHFILSATAPLIRRGVTTASIITYEANVIPGMVGAYGSESCRGILLKKMKSVPPTMPERLVPHTAEHPRMNHNAESTPKPLKVCMITEREFLIFNKLDLKKPSDGVIIITK